MRQEHAGVIQRQQQRKQVQQQEVQKKINPSKQQKQALGDYPRQPHHPLKYEEAPVYMPSQPRQQQMYQQPFRQPVVQSQQQAQQQYKQDSKGWTSAGNLWKSIKRNPVKSVAMGVLLL
ncbi:MAG: hypothetical protein RCG15_03950 [Candidatus Rickettsia vulgarisii]